MRTTRWAKGLRLQRGGLAGPAAGTWVWAAAGHRCSKTHLLSALLCGTQEEEEDDDGEEGEVRCLGTQLEAWGGRRNQLHCPAWHRNHSLHPFSTRPATGRGGRRGPGAWRRRRRSRRRRRCELPLLAGVHGGGLKALVRAAVLRARANRRNPRPCTASRQLPAPLPDELSCSCTAPSSAQDDEEGEDDDEDDGGEEEEYEEVRRLGFVAWVCIRPGRLDILFWLLLGPRKERRDGGFDTKSHKRTK